MSRDDRTQAAIVLLIICSILIIPVAFELVKRGETVLLITLASIQFAIVGIIARLIK